MGRHSISVAQLFAEVSNLCMLFLLPLAISADHWMNKEHFDDKFGDIGARAVNLIHLMTQVMVNRIMWD